MVPVSIEFIFISLIHINKIIIVIEFTIRVKNGLTKEDNLIIFLDVFKYSLFVFSNFVSSNLMLS